jgi:hypothetical protein
MKDKVEISKVIKLNQHQELDAKLLSDAKTLDDSLSPQLREKLFNKIAVQELETNDNKGASNTNNFNINKLAIAASLVFTLLAVQIFNHSEEAGKVQSIDLAESQQQQIEIKPVAEIKINDRIASNHLAKEYSAILADMEKIKHTIVNL